MAVREATDRSRGSGLLLCAILAVGACEAAGEPRPARPAAELQALSVPAAHASGQALFELHCAECHGAAAAGSDLGPPLVHRVYRPSHHADAAFHMAVQRGVRAHHWGYGDMPPQPAVSREETEEIIGYVRWLQRSAGVE